MKLFAPDPPNLQPYIQYRLLIPAIQKATKTMNVLTPRYTENAVHFDHTEELKYIDPDILLTELQKYIQVDLS